MDQSVGAYRGAVPINVGGGDQIPTRGPSRGLHVGTGGNLVCRLVNGASDIIYVGLLAGNQYPFQISIIRQTGTTITNSLLLY